jgi:cytochrome c-type biogenesis protein CcmH/NrfG
MFRGLSAESISPTNKSLYIISLLLILIPGLLYNYLGSWQSWIVYESKLAQSKKIKELIANTSKEELIQRLRQKLDDSPQSAHGWYLLGRVYMSQGNWLEAKTSFEKSRQLNPEDLKNSINYVISLWQINGQKGDPVIRDLLASILKTKPQQPDALALSAMDAFNTNDFPKAIGYWKQLLKQVPNDSEAAGFLLKAIQRAERKARL